MTSEHKESNRLQWKKVAIAITEKGNISPTHFGDATRILFAEVSPGKYRILESRPNPVRTTNEKEHGSAGKLKKATEFLKDVDIVATGKFSGNFRKMRTEKDKWPFITRMEPEVFLNWLIHSLPALESWFDDPKHTVYRT